MIQIFDRYNQASKDLHRSLLAAGVAGEVLVLEPDGFLPDGVQSPFTDYLLDGDQRGKPLYFNQIPLPDFWEIQGDNNSAGIFNHGHKKAHITYVPDVHERLVYQVDWLDQAGHLRQKDHYNRFGFSFAKTTYDQEGQPILTRYLTRDGLERILENHVTGHILLNLADAPLRTFPDRLAFTTAYIKQRFGTDQPILFNSLAQSFMLSYNLEGHPGTDILVWQEALGHDLPGNMHVILADNSIRANHILIPDATTYEQALSLIPEDQHHKLSSLGYVYDFKRENTCQKQALIATHSDQILHLEDLVRDLPELTFHIAAVTEMSSKLLAMLAYPNVRLYPNANQKQLADLYQKADLYLDINTQGELQSATRQAFEHRQLILAFEETAHGRQFTAASHLFATADYGQMVAKIKQVLADDQQMQGALEEQNRRANAISAQQLKQILEAVVKGDSHA